ncbi:hypothetical protein FBUS_07758, partial [Fasciolopsis buskii]
MDGGTPGYEMPVIQEETTQPESVSNSNVDPYVTNIWELAAFSRLRGQNAETEEKSRLANTNEMQVDGYEPEWESWDGGVGNVDIQSPRSHLQVKLAGFGHLCVLRENEVLESYFLIMAKKWMKAVLV